MFNPSTPGQLGNGLWRLLVLDTSDPDDARWLIASVTLPTDVKPAVMEGRKYTGWPQVVAWVREQVAGAGQVSITPLTAMCWRVDEGSPPD
jgi:hypothetical protein